jgi:hypothetical protein
MRRRCAGNFMVRATLTAGLFLGSGCAREDASSGADPQQPQAQVKSAATVTAATATPASAKDREHFGQVLKNKFDAGRVVKWQESPDGPVFVKPNGRAAHAVVAVKNSDGTISRHCLSSAAEVEALMNRSNQGSEQ